MTAEAFVKYSLHMTNSENTQCTATDGDGSRCASYAGHRDNHWVAVYDFELHDTYTLEWCDRTPDDLELIAYMVEQVATYENRITAAVARQRERGTTWTLLGYVLGTTRQAAWAKYSGRLD